jgi:hypothetical protein
VLGVVDEPVDGVTVGIVSGDELDPAVRAMGDTFVIGTVVAELTPRLPIW